MNKVNTVLLISGKGVHHERSNNLGPSGGCVRTETTGVNLKSSTILTRHLSVIRLLKSSSSRYLIVGGIAHVVVPRKQIAPTSHETERTGARASKAQQKRDADVKFPKPRME